MTLSEIKAAVFAKIDDERDTIIKIGENILKNPEVGYKEYKTSALVRELFRTLGMGIEYPCAITGVRGTLKGKSSETNVAVIGEMDALYCAGHPYADGSVAHACGHNAQVAAMLGVALAMKKSGVMEYLDGDVSFFAVPAEEFIDIDFRLALKKQGAIRAAGGKQQLVIEGAFDDVDMAMMVHAAANEPDAKLYTRSNNLGFMAKKITFFGRAAHGSRPYEGTNALNAAALALLGIHSNRETFKDEDKIRIHPIITRGGDVVNSVPDEVTIDTYVRGAGADAIKKGSDAVDRSVEGAAKMIGAQYKIENIPGYLPLCESPELSSVAEKIYTELTGNTGKTGQESIGSSDIGDLSNIMPVIQPSMGGFCGALHSKEFSVADEDAAYILPAKMMAGVICELLWDGANGAKKVKENFTAVMTKEEYIDYLGG